MSIQIIPEVKQVYCDLCGSLCRKSENARREGHMNIRYQEMCYGEYQGVYDHKFDLCDKCLYSMDNAIGIVKAGRIIPKL